MSDRTRPPSRPGYTEDGALKKKSQPSPDQFAPAAAEGTSSAAAATSNEGL